MDSSFGWFIPEVFEKQIGLDNGKTTPAWHLIPKNAGPQPVVYALPTEEARILSKLTLTLTPNPNPNPNPNP